MSINKWMFKQYTDEGCDVFVCLKCYNGWEGRTVCKGYHGYTDYGFEFCPFCGTKWEGEHVPVYKRLKQELPKDKWNTFWYNLPTNKFEVTAWWVMEKRSTDQFLKDLDEPDNDLFWRPIWRSPFNTGPVWRVLHNARREYIRHSRPARKINNQDEFEAWKKEPQVPVEECRLIRVKEKDWASYLETMKEVHGYIDEPHTTGVVYHYNDIRNRDLNPFIKHEPVTGQPQDTSL